MPSTSSVLDPRSGMPPLLFTGLALVLAAGPFELRAAVLLLAAPLLEETVFRLGLQQALARSLGPARYAAALSIGATALAFALAHALLNPSPLAAWTVVPALAIGALYHRTQRLAPCVALHAGFNLIWLAAAPALA